MLVCATLVLAVGFGAHAYDKREASTDFDLFVFAGMSPGAYCSLSSAKNCSSVSGTPNWTIHGLWPSNNTDKYGCRSPSDCDPSYKFNITEIQRLKPRLNKLWPSLEESGERDSSCRDESSNEYIWCHEWTTHGTCAMGVENINSEFDFFSTVLDLFEQKMEYDTHVLAKHNIFPSTTKPYSISAFANAFQEEWNLKPVIICTYDEDKHRQIVKGIRTCLDKTFNHTECPDCVFIEKNCKNYERIYYYPA